MYEILPRIVLLIYLKRYGRAKWTIIWTLFNRPNMKKRSDFSWRSFRNRINMLPFSPFKTGGKAALL